MRSANLIPYRGRAPRIDPTAFVAPNATLIGDVVVGAGASIWYNCVLRADLGRIAVGARSNVQDGSVIHTEGPRDGHQGEVLDTLIGADALVGHLAVLHGCVIEDRGFVGMGAIVMDRARVGSGAMLGAGAMLTPGKAVPAGELWAGRPAKFMRALGPAELAAMAEGVAHYLELAAHHRQALADG
jgi:carbonic anhydrase/acetyltransferase-like protein (isoleucine patch superfamily)